jgi:hypothetical protein
VYFPTAQVNVSNFPATYTVMVFSSTNFSNSRSFDDSVPAGSTYVGQAILGA